jgi:hypothetical protein
LKKILFDINLSEGVKIGFYIKSLFVDLGMGFFLIRFDSRTGFEDVLKGGPWFIGEHFLSLKPWVPNFRASEASVSSVAI